MGYLQMKSTFCIGFKVLYNYLSEKLKKQKEGEAETNKSTTAEGRRSERSSRRSTGSRMDSSSRSPERKTEKDSERRKKIDKPKVCYVTVFNFARIISLFFFKLKYQRLCGDKAKFLSRQDLRMTEVFDLLLIITQIANTKTISTSA